MIILMKAPTSMFCNYSGVGNNEWFKEIPSSRTLSLNLNDEQG